MRTLFLISLVVGIQGGRSEPSNPVPTVNCSLSEYHNIGCSQSPRPSLVLRKSHDQSWESGRGPKWRVRPRAVLNNILRLGGFYHPVWYDGETTPSLNPTAQLTSNHAFTILPKCRGPPEIPYYRLNMEYKRTHVKIARLPRTRAAEFFLDDFEKISD